MVEQMTQSDRSAMGPLVEDPAGAWDPRASWAIVARSWWIFPLAVAVAGGLGYLASIFRTPVYAATSKVLVQGGRLPGSAGGEMPWTTGRWLRTSEIS